MTEQRVMSVPGFGPKTAANLMVWRRQLEGRFVYNENTNATDTARLAAVKAEMNKLANETRQQLLAGPASLARCRADIEARREAIDPKLVALHERQAQLAVDLAA